MKLIKSYLYFIEDIYGKDFEDNNPMMMMANQSENRNETTALEFPSHFSNNDDGIINSTVLSNEANDHKNYTTLLEKTTVIDQVAEIDITEFRKHPAYSMYLNWSRLLVLGIIPFSLLVFFNSKIYNDINERRKRRLR